MRSSLAAVLVVSIVTLVSGDVGDWKQNIEYYENVHLECAKFNDEGTIHSVQAWILPSGEVRQPHKPVDNTHVYITDNGFSLSIDRLDDPDFGIYYCIVDKGVNYTGVIKIGVNVDGAYYGPAFMHELTNGAKIGGIAAACTVVCLAFLWAVCSYFSRKRSKFNHDRRAALHLHDIEETKSGDDSVYYIADGMPVDNGPDKPQQQQQHTPEVQREDRLPSTTSDHYHSIGTIEKAKKTKLNEDGSYENTAF